MSIVLEYLLLDRLEISITPRPEQFGFRAQHRTTKQLVNVLDKITNSLNKLYKTVAAFLDIEKALGRVWYDGLIFKLIEVGVLHQMKNIIKYF